MDIRKIHTGFITRRFPLAIALLFFFALRIPWLDKGNPLEFWASAVIQTGIAISLLYLTQTYNIVRQKTLLPAFFYVWLTGTNPVCFYNLRGSISAFLIVPCLAFLFHSYHNPRSQRNMLNISLILTLGSFYWAPLLFFFPLFWQGMYRFKIFNFKNFFAGVLGIVLIFLFLFAWSVYKGDETVFEQILSGWSVVCDFRVDSLDVKGWVRIAFVMLLFILSGVRIFMAGISEKVQTIHILSYLYMLAGILFVVFFFQNQWTPEWLLILYIPVSLLMAHYFTYTYRKSVSWLFLLTIIFFLGMFVWEWMILEGVI
ncbi:MAG: DUF6427 family protein [Dysgonamonadaceae bacterium]|jgi:hypothetical protein|nr:DUF6427 family protein [Dysgonamonadaceae bacterium]